MAIEIEKLPIERYLGRVGDLRIVNEVQTGNTVHTGLVLLRSEETGLIAFPLEVAEGLVQTLKREIATIKARGVKAPLP